MIECGGVFWLQLAFGFVGGCVFTGIVAAFIWPYQIDETDNAGC